MAVAIANTQTYENTSNGTSQTLSSYTPAAGSNRILVVRIHGMRTSESGAFTVDSVTFGGVGLTEAVTISTTSTSRTYRTAIWYLINPSSSAGNVVATFSHTSNSTILAASTLTGAKQTSPVFGTDTDYNSGSPAYLALQVSGTPAAGSIGLYAVTTHCNNNPTFSWLSPFTEEYDIRTSSNTSTEIAGASGWRDSYLYSEVNPESTQSSPKCGVAAVFLPATAAQEITPGSIATAESIGGLATTTGPVTITATSIATAQSVPGPVASPGAVGLSPTAIASLVSFGSPGVTPGAVSIAPASVATGESHGTATFDMGSVNIAASSIATAESIGGGSVGVGAATIAPAGIATLENLPTPLVSTGGVVVSDGVVSAETFGTAAMTTGGVSVAPPSISTAENVNGVTLGFGGAVVTPDSIATAESMPGPVLSGYRWISTVSTGGDDAQEDTNGFIYRSTTSGNVTGSSYAAFLIRNLPIPAGATVVHAYLRLYMYTYDDPDLTVWAEKNNSPADLTTATNDISDRTLTDTSVTWTASNLGVNRYNDSADLAAVLQEVVNLSGWTENTSDVLFVLQDNGAAGHIRFNMADNATDKPQLVVDYVLGDTAQTITTSGISSGESLGASALTTGAATISPANGIETLEAVSIPSLIVPLVLTDAGEIGTEFYATGGVVTQGGPVVTVDDGVASEESIGTQVITSPAYITVSAGVEMPAWGGGPEFLVGDLSILPDGIASLEDVAAPVLSAQAIVTPAAIASLEAIGAAGATPGTVNIVATAISSAESMGAAFVTTGAWVIQADSLTTVESFGTVIVTPAAVVISPNGLTSLESWGAAVVLALTSIEAAAIATAESVETPTVTPGAFALAPTSVASVESWGTAALSAVAYVAPDGASSVGNFGALTLVPGGIAVTPAAIASQEAVGTPSLQFGTISILPSGFASSGAFGAPVLSVGPTLVAPMGIPSAEWFGLLLLVARFLPTVNIRRVPFKVRVYTTSGKYRVYGAPFKARVYVVEE